MNESTIQLLADKAKAKVALLKESKLKYIVSAMFSGLLVGMGCILVYSVGGMLYAEHSPFTKIAVGLSFSFALSIILILGYELFTSNTMVMTVGALDKKTTMKDWFSILTYSYVGNFLGAVLISVLFVATGLTDKGTTIDYFAYVATAKVSGTALQLFAKGFLCNILVCAAVLCAYKLKDQIAQLFISLICLYAFVTSGFEHCIANMTVFVTTLLSPGSVGVITASQALCSTVFVSLGNIVGGAIFYGVATYFLSKEKTKNNEKEMSKAC